MIDANANHIEIAFVVLSIVMTAFVPIAMYAIHLSRRYRPAVPIRSLLDVIGRTAIPSRLCLIAAWPLLFIIMSSTLADVGPAGAAMTVYRYIVGVEALIVECGTVDRDNTNDYEKIQERYRNVVGNIVKVIGLLVGKEAKRGGVAKGVLFDSIDYLMADALKRSDSLARTDSKKFISLCRHLPKSMIAGTDLFQPLSDRFPEEIKVIRDAETTNRR